MSEGANCSSGLTPESSGSSNTEDSSHVTRTAETPFKRKTTKVIRHDDGSATVIMYCPCGKIGEIRTNQSNLPGKTTVSYVASMMSVERMATCFRNSEKGKDLFPDDESARRYVACAIHNEECGMPEFLINKRLKTRDYDMRSSTRTDSTQPEEHLCRWVKYANLSNKNSQTCNICQDDYKCGDKIAMLYYCFHEYHVDCIKEWLRRKNLCPTCKRLAINPRSFPDWKGDNIRHHQLYFDLAPQHHSSK